MRSSRPRRCSRGTPASWGRHSPWSRRARAPARRSCRRRPSRRTSWPRSTTTTSENGPLMSGTWAGGWRRSCPGEERPDLWHPDGTPAVLVAADLDPSAVATLRPELVAGIALAGGDADRTCRDRRARARDPARARSRGLVDRRRDRCRRGCRRGRWLPWPTPHRAVGGGPGRIGSSRGGGVDGDLGLVTFRRCRAAWRVGRCQRRLAPRGGGGDSGRGGRDRPRPDGAVVPGPLHAAVGRRAARDLRPDPRGDGRSAGRLPDARRRRR